tara:strand:+ start:683 stop:1096 length:414 start_codon:yes stop_codon:yes gene_type:complete
MENTTINEIIKDWEETIKDSINALLEYDFRTSTGDRISLDDYENDICLKDDLNDSIQDMLHEIIDGCEDVIYTHNAKKISDIIGKYDAFGTWDVTGERFNNWMQVAYANIYDLIQEEIDIEKLIVECLKDVNHTYNV